VENASHLIRTAVIMRNENRKSKGEMSEGIANTW